MNIYFFIGLILGILIVCIFNDKQGYLNIESSEDKQDFLQNHFNNDCMEIEHIFDENKKEYIQPKQLGPLNCGINKTSDLEKDSECMIRAKDNNLNFGECANINNVESCYGVNVFPTDSGINSLMGCGECLNGRYTPYSENDDIPSQCPQSSGK